MMNINHDIFAVDKVRAIRLMPDNGNAVTISIETEGGVLQQTLYFGYSTKKASDAAALFYALGGTEEDVVRR